VIHPAKSFAKATIPLMSVLTVGFEIKNIYEAETGDLEATIEDAQKNFRKMKIYLESLS
jgi:hypothetical protein